MNRTRFHFIYLFFFWGGREGFFECNLSLYDRALHHALYTKVETPVTRALLAAYPAAAMMPDGGAHSLFTRTHVFCAQLEGVNLR